MTQTGSLELAIIRHGSTPGNDERRYVDAVDQPLSASGRAQAEAAVPYLRQRIADVRRVYVSTLRRTHETAAILFPCAEQVVVEGVQEMDFGSFAGRSADEMREDDAYRAWVEGNCKGRCPGGEARDEFTERVCRALANLLEAALARDERRVVLVAHGGTMMAALSHFCADDGRDYYEWLVGNCQGYRIDVDMGGNAPRFANVERL